MTVGRGVLNIDQTQLPDLALGVSNYGLLDSAGE